MKTQSNNTDFFKKLIAFESTYKDISAMHDCMNHFEAEFKDALPFVTHHEFGPHKKPVMVMANVEGKEFDIIFSGHIDVVPAAVDGLFELREDDENFYGRGVLDMKLPLAAVSFGVRDFLSAHTTDLKIGLIITSDEEIDGMSVRHAANDLGYKARFAIIPDGGFENGIVVGQKGFFQFKVMAQGLTCHASKPNEGENALDKLFDLYQSMREKFPLPASPEDWRTSLSMTAFSSGDASAVNQIPSEAVGYFDMRWVAESDKQDVITMIEDAGFDWSVVAENGMLHVSPEETPFFREFEQAVAETMPNPVEYVRTCGTSDAIFFVEGGTPTTLFLPNGGGMHANDEWVNKKSLARVQNAVTLFLDKVGS